MSDRYNYLPLINLKFASILEVNTKYLFKILILYGDTFLIYNNYKKK